MKADAKGAIYLTTKNGTFPISLTSLNSQDDVTQDAARIFSATTKNVTSLQWDDIADDILFSNSNETQDYDNMWKNNQKRSINDAVSKNITLVLENLLKNYENSQLPTHGKGM